MSIQNWVDVFKDWDKKIQNLVEDKIKALDKNNTEILNAMHFGSEEELLNFRTGLLSINMRKINNIDTLITKVYALYEKRRQKLVKKITSTPPQHYDWKGKTTEEWKDWYKKHMQAMKTLSQFRSKFWIDFNDLLYHYYYDKYSNIDKQELSNWKSKMVKRMLNYFQEYNRDRWMYHFSIKNMENFSKATYLIKSLNNNNNLKKKQEDRFDNNITDTVVINNKSNVMDNDLKINMLNALTHVNNTQLKTPLFNFNNANPSYNYNISNNAQNIDYDYLSMQQIAEMENSNQSNQPKQINNVNDNINYQLSKIPQIFTNNLNFNFPQANIGMHQNISNNAQNNNAQNIGLQQIFTNNSNFKFYQANIDMPHQPLNNNGKGLVNTGNFTCYTADMNY